MIKSILFSFLCVSWLTVFSQDYKEAVPDPDLWVSNPYDTLILDSLLLDANKLDKPLLLYFYGSNNVNSLKFNNTVFSDVTLSQEIKNHFYPVLFDVASREPIAAERIREVNGVRHIVWMGKRNLEFQQMLTRTATQPCFVIIDLKGNIVSQHGYLGGEYRLKEHFIEFLKTGFAACK